MTEDNMTSVSSAAVSTQEQDSGEGGRNQSLNTTIRSSWSANDESRNEAFTNPKQAWQLRQTLEGVVKEINAKRERDASMLSDFKKELEVNVAESYGKVEKALYDVYEENSATITEKLEELFAVLDRIGKLEVELEGFMSNLKLLISDIQEDTLGSNKSEQ